MQLLQFPFSQDHGPLKQFEFFNVLNLPNIYTNIHCVSCSTVETPDQVKGNDEVRISTSYFTL